MDVYVRTIRTTKCIRRKKEPPPPKTHLDTGIKMCILMNVTKTRICRISMGREREVGETAGNSIEMTQAKKVLGCSSTTSNTVLREELGMYPIKTKRRESC